MNRTVSFGELINATFAEVGANRVVVAIYLALSLPIAAVAAVFEADDDPGAFGLSFGTIFRFGEDVGLVGGLVGFVAFVLGVLLTYWFYAALVERQPAPGFRRFWAFIAVYLLSILGIGLASLALVIPGIIVAVRWTPLIPVLLSGDEPLMASFSTSWRMTSGSSWPIFGVCVVLIAVGLFLSFLFELLGSLAGGPGSIAAAVLSVASEDIVGMLFTVLAVATWRSLADQSAEAAAVFE